MTSRDQDAVIERAACIFGAVEVDPLAGSDVVSIRGWDDGHAVTPHVLLTADCDPDAEVEALEHMARCLPWRAAA